MSDLEKLAAEIVRQARCHNVDDFDSEINWLTRCVADGRDKVKAAQAPASGEVEPAVYWVLYDSASEKKYIKKCIEDGSLAFFETEAEAKRAKNRHGETVGYTRIEYYTHPPAKVPDNVALNGLIESARCLGSAQEVNKDAVDYWSEKLAFYKEQALLTTPTPATTPEAEWVKCEDRLPEPRKPSRKAQNGILIKFDNGRITHYREISETLVMTMRNGPRQVLKFETPKPPRIVEWLDLDAPTPPTAQGGEGDE